MDALTIRGPMFDYVDKNVMVAQGQKAYDFIYSFQENDDVFEELNCGLQMVGCDFEAKYPEKYNFVNVPTLTLNKTDDQFVKDGLLRVTLMAEPICVENKESLILTTVECVLVFNAKNRVVVIPKFAIQ